MPRPRPAIRLFVTKQDCSVWVSVRLGDSLMDYTARCPSRFISKPLHDLGFPCFPFVFCRVRLPLGVDKIGEYACAEMLAVSGPSHNLVHRFMTHGHTKQCSR